MRRHHRDRLGELLEHPALERLAREAGCARVFRVNSADELPDDLAAPSGSPPALGARRARRRRHGPPGAGHGVEEVRVTDEDEYFPPPRELRDLLSAIDVVAHSGSADPTPTGPKSTTGAAGQ